MGPSLKFSWGIPSACCNCNMATKHLIIALWLSDHALIKFWMLWNMNSNDTDFEKVNNIALSSKSILISFRSWKNCHKTTPKDSRVIWIHYLIISVLCQFHWDSYQINTIYILYSKLFLKNTNFFKETSAKCRKNSHTKKEEYCKLNLVFILVKRGLPNCCFHLTVMQLSIV